MRVKLAYTVDEDNVLEEAAKLLGLSADDMQRCIDLFGKVQDDLTGAGEEGSVPNVRVALGKIEKFRKALLNVDTRLSEVVDIIQSYEDYKTGLSRERLQPLPPVEAPATDEE